MSKFRLRYFFVFSLFFVPSLLMSQSQKNPADMMRELRLMALTAPASKFDTKPTKDFPRTYGILMDWPLGDQIITVVAFSSGDASLYTTSTFGVIGGAGHEKVRIAALKFVQAGDKYFDGSKSTSEYPYPSKDKVRFYLVTFQGVRVIEADKAQVESRKDPFSELFDAGQNVLTELRITTENKIQEHRP